MLHFRRARDIDDLLDRALVFVIGVGIGLFVGGSVMWWALP